MERVLFALHMIVGVGAVAGGFAAISNPWNPLGAPASMLEHSPFQNFLIPGILLFAVIGLGNLVSAAAVFFRPWYRAYVSSVFSWALVIWIVVQCVMLRSVVFLHVLFFLIGAVEAALSMILLFQQRLFPSNLVIGCWEKVVNRGKRA